LRKEEKNKLNAITFNFMKIVKTILRKRIWNKEEEKNQIVAILKWINQMVGIRTSIST
jgi:hypothetical protein